jgi:ADP-heptose:LPS heptosyltransferase
MEKILVIRLSSIGDIIQCSAVPRHLRLRFPNAQIHWLVRADNGDLVQHNPHLNEIISFDRKNGLAQWIKLCLRLRKSAYTHVYDAHNNLRSHLLTLFVRPKFFIRRSKNRFKRFLLFIFKLNLFGEQMRAVDSYIAPLRPWGIHNDYRGSELRLSAQVFDKVRPLLAKEKKWIAVAPATAWPKKTWPEAYWKNLIGLILSETYYNILILGGPKDDFCKNLILDGERVISLQGRLSLMESAAAVHFCETLVAADTGLLHMAESLGRNVVGILGPTPFGHPARPGSIGLQKKIWCQPCSKDGSGPCVNFHYQECMKRIEPVEVIQSIQAVLRNS